MANAPAATSPVVPTNVFTGEDFYVPSFKILIRNQQPKIMHDVISVTYTDSLTNIDSFELVINNCDPDKATADPAAFISSPFKYSDEHTFDPWQPVELWMGYIRNGNDQRQKMLTGEIATMSPTFPTSGGSTLSVRGLNLLHRFRVKQETKPFFKKKDSDIAKSIVENIAKELRKVTPQLTLQLDQQEYSNNIANELEIPYVDIHNQYPINLLLERSRDIGYELYVEEVSNDPTARIVTIHYHPTAAENQIVYKLEWGKSLISFQPTLQTANQVSSVTVKGWDPAGKTKIEVTVNRKDVKNIVHPADLDVDETDLAQKEEIVVDHPISNAAEAKLIAKNRMLRLAQGIVIAKGKAVGLPSLRSGVKIIVDGLGQRFSGTYVITSTTHTMGEGGYTTDFSARMEAKLASNSKAGAS